MFPIACLSSLACPAELKISRRTEFLICSWAGLCCSKESSSQWNSCRFLAQLRLRHSQEVTSMHSDVNSTISEHWHSQIFKCFTATLYKQIILQHIFSSLLQWKRTTIWVSGESIGGIYNGGHDLVAEDRIYRVSTQFLHHDLAAWWEPWAAALPVGWTQPMAEVSGWASWHGVWVTPPNCVLAWGPPQAPCYMGKSSKSLGDAGFLEVFRDVCFKWLWQTP